MRKPTEIANCAAAKHFAKTGVALKPDEYKIVEEYARFCLEIGKDREDIVVKYPRSFSKYKVWNTGLCFTTVLDEIEKDELREKKNRAKRQKCFT